MKSKILFILHLPPPVHGSSMVGRYIKDSILVENTFDRQFINLSTSLTINEIGKNPIIKIFRYFKIFFKILLVLFNFKPNIVYLAITAKGIGFYKDLPIALLVKLFGKKLILHLHNKGVSNFQHRFFDNLLYKILFKNSKVILLSERLFKDVSKYVRKKDVYFCPNGIPDVYDLKNKSKKNEIPEILFLSNLIESKGVYIFLEALKLLKDEDVQFLCNIVGGEGNISSKKLNKKISDLNLDEFVTFQGKKYGDEKNDILKSSDIFVFPTFYPNECFPLVLLEAMQFNLPIISTNEGGIADIVKNNETGFIIEKENSKQLSEKIKWLIDNPQKAKLMGEKGRDYFLKNYTSEVFEIRLKKILQDV
jgi:glycosyltransferase involved in cell wall biosynthesis